MALPRRCKHCKCFAAPWLDRCPRCGKSVPLAVVVVKLTKEEQQAERLKKDEDVPTIHQKNMQWVPSAFSIASHKVLLDEAKRKLDRAETAHERNVIRSEIRIIKSVLNKTADAKHKWTTELFHAKQASISIFISPKGQRYVTALGEAKADLIIINRKRAANPRSRLQLFEKSPYAKMVKQEKKEAATHTKRKKAKKKKKSSTLS